MTNIYFSLMIEKSINDSVKKIHFFALKKKEEKS